jgi:hypothetical protein
MQYLSDNERIELSELITPIIRDEDLKSALLVIDIRNTTITIESMRAVKKDWIDTAPHIRQIGLIGVKGSMLILFKLLRFMIPMNVITSNSPEKAERLLCR